MKPRDLFIVAVIGLVILITICGYTVLRAQTAISDLAWAEAHRNIGRSNNRLGAIRHQITQTQSPDFSDIHNFLHVINENTDAINRMEAEGKHFNGLLKLHHSPIVGEVTESVRTLNHASAQYEAQLYATINAYQDAVVAMEDSYRHPYFRDSQSESRQVDDLLHDIIELGNFSEQNLKSTGNKALITDVENLVEKSYFLHSSLGVTSKESVQRLLSNIALLEEKTQAISEIESVLSLQGTELFNVIDQVRLDAQSRNNLVFILAIIQLVVLAGVFINKALRLKRELVGQNLALEDTVALRTKRLESALDDLKSSTKQQTKTEARLRLALRAAEKAGEAKSAFLANMSHEIRTPMNGVLAMLELVLREETDEKKRDHLQISHSSALSLLNILDDVLDYSRLEAGQFTITPEPYELSKIIEEVTGLFRSKAETKDVAIVTTFESDLPKTIVGDHARVRQVISNLVSNALKFTKKGQVSVHVRREQGVPSEQIRIEIADTGIGISEEALAKLFQRFSQVDSSSTRQHGGTGLGLVLCKQLAELMGGSVGAESQEGKGSNFWLILPVRNSCSNIRSTTAATENNTSENLDTGMPNYDLKILAAEDNPVNQKVLEAMVSSLGYTATIVNNGQEVLDKLDSQSFDLILMDVQMPVMDGVSATKAIRALSGPMKDITIVALTANAMEGDRESYLAVGMDDYLSKPIEREKLAEALHRTSLKVSSAQAQLSEQNSMTA